MNLKKLLTKFFSGLFSSNKNLGEINDSEKF